MSAWRRWSLGERAILALPLIWLGLFFVAPFTVVVKISLSQAALAQPPYTPVFDPGAGAAALVEKLGELGFAAYAALADDWLYAQAYLASLRLAAIATLLTLLVAYPLAYAMARAPHAWRPALVLLAMAPFWTSFLIRVYAWIALLKDEGLINKALIALGVIDTPIEMFATRFAVIVGIVYSYLPFMQIGRAHV